MERRSFLRGAVIGTSAAAFGGTLWQGAASAAPAQPGPGPYGALGSADANGIQLPAGFTSRVIARSGQAVAGTSYTWHSAPDGGACFADGTGWIYVSNSEINPVGGASAVQVQLRPAPITGAYRILSGTNSNCAGGATPWNTWLSCEEVGLGYVYETDPCGVHAARARPAMGRFKHEAAAADPVRQVVYLTEDETDGCFYRFVPTTWGDLSSGTLAGARRRHRHLRLVHLGERPRPGRLADRAPAARCPARSSSTAARAATTPTTPCWFTTKGDNRVWQLNVADQHLRAGLRRLAGRPPAPPR